MQKSDFLSFCGANILIGLIKQGLWLYYDIIIITIVGINYTNVLKLMF